MNFRKRFIVSIFAAGVLAALPTFASSPQGLVGVAQGSGSIKINGQPFGGQASLFSGDKILTGPRSLLTVISSPSEQARFKPGTSAQVARQGENTVIRLNTGAVEFRTAGAVQAYLPNGITVRPAVSTKTLAQVNRLANGTSEVAVYKGSVEVANAKEHVTVNAGHTAVIEPGAGSQNANANQNNNKKKKLWAIFIATGLSGGAVAAVLANKPSNNVSAVDP